MLYNFTLTLNIQIQLKISNEHGHSLPTATSTPGADFSYIFFWGKFQGKFRGKFSPKNVGKKLNFPRKKFWKIVFPKKFRGKWFSVEKNVRKIGLRLQCKILPIFKRTQIQHFSNFEVFTNPDIKSPALQRINSTLQNDAQFCFQLLIFSNAKVQQTKGTIYFSSTGLYM
jgi:hypothetical protein